MSFLRSLSCEASREAMRISCKAWNTAKVFVALVGKRKKKENFLYQGTLRLDIALEQEILVITVKLPFNQLTMKFLHVAYLKTSAWKGVLESNNKTIMQK